MTITLMSLSIQKCTASDFKVIANGLLVLYLDLVYYRCRAKRKQQQPPSVFSNYASVSVIYQGQCCQCLHVYHL